MAPISVLGLIVVLAVLGCTPTTARNVGNWLCTEPNKTSTIVQISPQDQAGTIYFRLVTVVGIAKRLVPGGTLRMATDDGKGIRRVKLREPMCLDPETDEFAAPIVCTMFPEVIVDLAKLRGIRLKTNFNQTETGPRYLPCYLVKGEEARAPADTGTKPRAPSRAR